ncbi:MAG: hypothetical protein ABSD51_06510, partial [Candidatus Binatus sp.]
RESEGQGHAEEANPNRNCDGDCNRDADCNRDGNCNRDADCNRNGNRDRSSVFNRNRRNADCNSDGHANARSLSEREPRGVPVSGRVAVNFVVNSQFRRGRRPGRRPRCLRVQPYGVNRSSMEHSWTDDEFCFVESTERVDSRY